MRLFLVAVLSCCLSACASLGNKFDGEAVSKMVVGQTTMNEAIEKMGKPVATAVNGDVTAVTWMYSSGTMFGAKANQVTLTFDSSGKLMEHMSQSEAKTGGWRR